MDRPVRDYKGTAGADVLQFIAHAGADTIAVIDAHSEIVLGAVPLTVSCRNLNSNRLIETVVSQMNLNHTILVSPDVGAVKRCKSFIDFFKDKTGHSLDLAVVDKTRKHPNEVESIQLLLGDVSGKHCLILDDMVDTGVF